MIWDQVYGYGWVGHGCELEWYVPIRDDRCLSIVCAFGSRVSCRMCMLQGCGAAHVPRGVCEVGRMYAGVQYERTWFVERVLLLLFVLMLVIICDLIDFLGVVCCTCLCFNFDPGRVVFRVVRVAAFHVGVLQDDEASLFVITAWVGDLSGGEVAPWISGGPSSCASGPLALCWDLLLLLCYCLVYCDPVVFVRELFQICRVECDKLHADRCCGWIG